MKNRKWTRQTRNNSINTEFPQCIKVQQLCQTHSELSIHWVLEPVPSIRTGSKGIQLSSERGSKSSLNARLWAGCGEQMLRFLCLRRPWAIVLSSFQKYFTFTKHWAKMNQQFPAPFPIIDKAEFQRKNKALLSLERQDNFFDGQVNQL